MQQYALIFPLVFFAAYTLLSGLQQGIIVWLLREYVPPTRKDWIDAAYHTGGLLLYGLLLGYAVHEHPAHWPWLAGGAVLTRALVFDPALNTARSWFNHREGRPWGNLFEVGTTAFTDKALRKLAPANPDRLRFCLWLAALVAYAAAVAGLAWGR